MSEKRKVCLDQLLDELKSLEEGVLAVRSNGSQPFSFFRESFDKTQNITRLLHELESMQIDDMKEQMERLVHFLSETEKKEQEKEQDEKEREKKQELEKEREQEEKEREEKGSEKERAEQIPEEENSDTTKFDTKNPFPSMGNKYAEGVVLPEYKDPRVHETLHSYSDSAEPTREVIRTERPVTRSLNDTIHTSPAVVDLKRGVSLNDRFLFQRELFNNDRREMDETMDKLNSLDSYEEAERYLRDSKSWNFESTTVVDFLLILKKSFQ